ncbi:sugar ABC transporter substrate-binding protein [Mesotoga sp.]|uniref:ABC transporter substrate-binding protein n=1 Tax=Mesotoga sp. TaxID=2053577 RepID=UPI00262BA526|nr:sugar ABC transporter substrate-binding protein [Mesotoga sp.]MDD4208540.1 sugar ABC transporter substrate-binding protein [Mesotoga sp.]
MKRFLVVLVVASMVLTTSLLGVTTIKFMNFSSADANAKYLEEMKEIFEEQNPDIKVEIETVGFGDYFTKLMTVVAGGNAPDAFELNYENFYTYAKKDVLLDLNDLLTTSGFDTSVLNERALYAFSDNGVQYGLPFSFSNVVLIYNKDLFDRAGAEHPREDWTWADELEAAKKIRALDAMTFGIYQPVQFWEFYKMVQQNGGSILNEDKTAFTLNSPQNIETLQYMVDRILESNVMPNDAQMAGMGDWDLFEVERIGMIVTGTWAFSTFKDSCDFNWDIAVEPGNTSKATHFFANGLAISKDSKKVDAAFRWISFLSGDIDVAKIRIEAGWELPPVTYPEIIELYKQTTPPESKEVVFKSLDYLVTPPVIEQFNEMADIVNRHLEAARYGEKTPEQALNDAQAELERSIKLD